MRLRTGSRFLIGGGLLLLVSMVALLLGGVASATAREACGTVKPSRAPAGVKSLRVVAVVGIACGEAEQMIRAFYTAPRRSPSGSSVYVTFPSGYTCLGPKSAAAGLITCRRGSSFFEATIVS
jgi:hypothetical protein